MNDKNREELIFEKEYEMWDAASKRDEVAFKQLVATDAIMICGGYRCLGGYFFKSRCCGNSLCY